jgi:hypothetical protein
MSPLPPVQPAPPASTPTARPRRPWWVKALIALGCVVALIVLVIVGLNLLIPPWARNPPSPEGQCASNLRQLGYSIRVHAVNHDFQFPSAWTDATNEVHPYLLICPGDRTNSMAATWESVGATNVTYRYLGQGALVTQTNRVVGICPIHGHVLLGNGKVVRSIETRFPGALSDRDGAQWVDLSKISEPTPASLKPKPKS